MAADILCSTIYKSVAHIKDQAERMDALKEDARKLHRYLKRVEAVVSDLQPYYTQQQTSQGQLQAQLQAQSSTDSESAQNDSISTAAQVLAGLHGVQAVLSEVQDMLEQACSRGKLSTYLQADRLLQQFQAATSDLEAAVGQLPCSSSLLGSAHEETAEQLDSLRAALHKVKFELSAEHAQQLQFYRAACDSLQGPVQQLQASCKDILQQVCGHDALTRDEFAAAVADLQREVRQLQQHQELQQASISSGSTQQQPPSPTAGSHHHQQQKQQSDEFYLRMMCDLLRVKHQQEGVPLEFTCPLTTAIMHDPVILHETGHSYERQAIEDWFASGHRLCPKTGTALGKKLNISPNHALRAAIRTWSEASDLQLRFRPLLRGALADNKNMLTPAFGAPHDQDGRPLPAAMTSGQLGNILAGGSSGISPSSSTSTDLDAIEGSPSTAAAGGGTVAAMAAAGGAVGGGTGSFYTGEPLPALHMGSLDSSTASGMQQESLAVGNNIGNNKAEAAGEVLEPELPVSKQALEAGVIAVAPAGAEEADSS